MIYVFTGTRHTLSDRQTAHVVEAIEEYKPDEQDEVYVGCAGGVDAYVRDTLIPNRVFTADWNTYRYSAGPRRNSEMLDYALERACGDTDVVLVLAFPAAGSKGTWDCVRQAAARGLRVHIHPVPL